MKAPNFKITICGLNLYFSVHCVSFGLFLHLCYRWGNRREKNHTGWFFSPWFSCSLSAYEYDQDKEQDCKNYCCSFEYHIHRAILNSIIKLLWQLQISLLDFWQLFYSLCILSSEFPQWRLQAMICLLHFSRLLLNSVCCTFCWFCISSSVLPCCSSCFWRSALTFEAASICSLACLWVCSFAFLRASVCNLSCSWLSFCALVSWAICLLDASVCSLW